MLLLTLWACAPTQPPPSVSPALPGLVGTVFVADPRLAGSVTDLAPEGADVRVTAWNATARVDADGGVIAVTPLAPDPGHQRLWVSWDTDGDGAPDTLASNEETRRIADGASIPAPSGARPAPPNWLEGGRTTVRFHEGGPTYEARAFGVMAGSDMGHKAYAAGFELYDGDVLVHREILADEGGAGGIAAIPDTDGEGQRLLVGGHERVWAYRLP